MLAFLGSLWAKFAVWIAGGAAVLAALLFCLILWALDGKSDAEAELLDTKDQLAAQVEENERLGLSLAAAEATADRRSGQRDTQARDEEAIRNEPVTYECAASPAVRGALGILSDRRAGDTPEPDRPE